MKINNSNVKKILNPQPNLPSKGPEFSLGLPSVHSRPTLLVENFEEGQKIYTSDFNLTIRIKVTEFTRKQATLLAGQALRQVAQEGLNITDWMSLECLYTYLLGNKLDYSSRRDPKEFELSLLLKVTLLATSWMDLEGKVQLPDDVQQFILNSHWVPSQRTYDSRRDQFRMNKFIQLRFVPIENFYERSNDTIRYSSYCKGYGESGPTGHKKKTRPTFELDGEPVDLEEEGLIKLSFQRFQQVQDLLLLETKYISRK